MHKDIHSTDTSYPVSNFNLTKYEHWLRTNVDYNDIKDHDGGRYIGTTPEIEDLRPQCSKDNI